MKKITFIRVIFIAAVFALAISGSQGFAPVDAGAADVIAAQPLLYTVPLTYTTPLVPLTPVVYLCPTDLPDPVLNVVGSESYTVGGQAFVRYLLSVVNRHEYPDSLFSQAPHLPACGFNTNSSRTWVDIYDQDGVRIYGFCALGSAEGLGGLWFAVADGATPPTGVRIIMNDRECEKEYTSNLVSITPGQYSPPPSADLEIQSTMDASPPVIDGVASGAEWADANTLPLHDTTGTQQGVIYVKNDRKALYILLDMTGDGVDGARAVDDDYSGIAFDIGLDGYKSPGIDLRYASAAGTETLGIQYPVSSFGWTGMNALAAGSLSEYREGMGATPSSSSSHKFYEYKLDYSEIDIDYDEVLANPGLLYQARISVEAVSTTPRFYVYYPSHYNSFSNAMIRIALDLGGMSVASDAPVIAGIGLVPRTFIDQTNGLATTSPGDQIEVTDAPFGGHLRVIGNLDALRDANANYYAMAYCNMDVKGCAALGEAGFNFSEWTFVEDARANYYWNSTQEKYILDSKSPDIIFSSGDLIFKAYPVPSDAVNWYFPNLLFDWRTTGSIRVNSGLYKLHLFAFYYSPPSLSFRFTATGGESLVVRIDNTHPVMSLNAIYYDSAELERCALVQLDDAYDTLTVNISAYDPDGFLDDFHLYALYGNNESFTCEQMTYEDYLTGGGSGPDWYPAYLNGNYICKGDAGDHWETSCGYTFVVAGWDRAINGYGPIHKSSGHRTITVLMPDYQLCP